MYRGKAFAVLSKKNVDIRINFGFWEYYLVHMSNIK